MATVTRCMLPLTWHNLRSWLKSAYSFFCKIYLFRSSKEICTQIDLHIEKYLDSLIKYEPSKNSSEKAEKIIESVLPRLSHANPSVVLSAVKVILKFLDLIENVESVRHFSKKLSSSLMTIMTSRSEIQYILLRGMHAIIQKRPYLFEKEFRYFFIQ